MKKIFLLVTIFFLLSATTPAFVGAATEYKLLAPIPLKGVAQGDVPTTTAAPYLKGVFMLIIAIAGGLAVIRIIFGGIKYLAIESITGKSDAKETIQNAIWGLLLIISAWLILYTINPKLVDFNLSIPVQTIGTGDNNLITGQGGAPLSQAEVLSRFTAAGVQVAGAITLEGLREGIVNETIRLNSECISVDPSCKVFVTSAVRSGDGTVCSHASGNKVDLRSGGQGIALTNFIKNNYQKFPNRSDGALMYRSPGGIFYALEIDHWDVAVC